MWCVKFRAPGRLPGRGQATRSRWPGQLLFPLAALLALGPARGAPEPETAPAAQPVLSTASGLNGRLHVTGPDRVVNAALVQAAEDSYRILQPLLKLPRSSPHDIEMEVVPSREGLPPDSFALRLVVVRETPSFVVAVSVDRPESRDAYLRTLVELFLYEKMLAAYPGYLKEDALPSLPLWLTEGTFLTLLQGQELRLNKVIAQAVAGHRAPDLETVRSWWVLSDEPVRRAWQQAFCHYLLTSVARPGENRERFHNWLEQPKTYPYGMVWPVDSLIPSEIEWRSHLADSRERTRSTILTWEQTAAAFAGMQSLELTDPKNQKPMVTSLDAISPAAAALPENQEPLATKRSDLLGLEMRAHFLWRPVLTAYRMALANAGKPRAKPTYTELVALAKEELAKLTKAQSNLNDYLNWYEITTQTSDATSSFTPYRRLRLHLDALDTRQSDSLRHETVKVERKTRR